MSEITVQPLGIRPDEIWIAAGPPDAPPEKTVKALIGRFQRDPRGLLVAERDGEPIGRMLGNMAKPSLYVVRACEVRTPGTEAEVGVACGQYLLRTFGESDTELLLWASPDNEVLYKSLTEAGYQVDRKKAYVERTVLGYRSEHEDPFTYRSLEDVGTDAFVEAMTLAALGDPFEDVTERDPRADFDQLVSYAGERFDPAMWHLAYLEDKVAGVVLPQPYPSEKKDGTLFYVAVVPEFRGRGYGKILHGVGLTQLATQGVEKYVGATDMRNAPMLRIFQANGCRHTQTQLFFQPA